MMRLDIQFLRGVSVLAVVIYHAGILSVSGGYLGVDVFFVISGFLITTIILKDVDRGFFSFIGFYIRRAKRLLPAAYVTLIFTSLLAYIILTANQWGDYLLQLIGAVTFSANIILPFQTGYFDSASEGKPLLHMWSLSLEEQYYFFIPLLIVSLSSRYRSFGFGFAALTSLILCFVLVGSNYTYWRLPQINAGSMAFYSLFTRGWELTFGSLLAWAMLQYPHMIVSPKFKYFALFVLLIVIIHPIDSVHPRFDALIVVICTILLLAGQDNWLPSWLLTRSIATIGDWSYSLYLVHWPLFAFSNIAYLGVVPQYVKIILVIVSLLLAYLQYQYIEQHFRYGWKVNRQRTLNWLIGATLLVFVIPLPAIVQNYRNLNAKSFDIPNNNAMLSECSEVTNFPIDKSCMTTSLPTFALWGDSYAKHLIPGLMSDPVIGSSLVQITKPACAPIRGVASIDSKYNEVWARGCLEFNESAFRYIVNSETIKYVIMSSPFSGYFDVGSLQLFYNDQVIVENKDLAVNKMIETIGYLKKAGKQVIVVSPPPRDGFDIGLCLNRKSEGVIVLGKTDCTVLVVDYLNYQSGIIDSLNEVQLKADVRVARIDDVLCNTHTCQTTIGGQSIYKDGGHLTEYGSKYVVKNLGLSNYFRLTP